MSVNEHLGLWGHLESSPHFGTRTGHAVGSASHRVAEPPKVARKRRKTMGRTKTETIGTITQLPSGSYRVRWYALSEEEEKKLAERFFSVFSSEEGEEKTREPFRVAGFLPPEDEEDL